MVVLLLPGAIAGGTMAAEPPRRDQHAIVAHRQTPRTSHD